MPFSSFVASSAALCLAPFAAAQIDQPVPPRQDSVVELDTGEIVASDLQGTYVFDTWDEYMRSSFFFRNGKHCGFSLQNHPPQIAYLGSQADCTNSASFPAAEYDPTGGSAAV